MVEEDVDFIRSFPAASRASRLATNKGEEKPLVAPSLLTKTPLVQLPKGKRVRRGVAQSFVRKKLISGAAVAGGRKEADPAASAPQSKRRIKKGTLHIQRQQQKQNRKKKRERGVKKPSERSGPCPMWLVFQAMHLHLRDAVEKLEEAQADITRRVVVIARKETRETPSPAVPWDRPRTERL
ncbi:uncharacterized protein LOC133626821 isoform X2 [Colius striatus]|uniref:uncharacterized protein LOC133626821 isoform X2 n=1 Tax=Colius striatus TaxID=57412 RepID=UPI002B1D5BC9|nr:uncharacterized protein LOC133626821 isoform X2 [Colius striatus]